ncbi:uncharacterized protein LOC121654512 isoform X2 [Melanotaenia boesemani]|uniref:uncharacterized protein LOC121640143 isoform X2 n=1 Tax=Melanotaenia boesemani TaxID=1250792 RepID=UPI001C04C438|nr:uncharacterized protein LOC121640143 isoform X2 [Melanotaenia boesemani]XP_041862672.1 uncharacterized protein LOC121653336 isoform X2 [Melanotaenia boesemani]XP_041863634.1 uncharacterized protein LOC121653914 isoform X2 [Melanotaenia boesemani]XP_041864619.1 uncharacterized protein LOC121654512 isoform X2 [Melanotaenia boesemani]
MQVFQGLSLVDYPESDESEDGSTNLNSLAYCDKVVRKKRRMSHCVRPSPQSPYNSNESVVEDSDDNNDYVPKLRRTKSILMDGVPDFSDALYDSNDDNTEGPSTSKSEMVSQRQRRACFNPLQPDLIGSDDSGSSGEEYIPNPREESMDSDVSLECPLESKQKKIKSPKSRSKTSSHSQCEDRRKSLETSQDSTQRLDANEGEMAPLEEPSIYVNPVLKKEDGSRCYNKKHHCLYCNQVVQKMSRHLQRKHMDKVDVAKAFSLPKNSKVRRAQLDYIRNKGNFEHNIEVMESHQGKLTPFKQPNKRTDGQIFSHCVYCYGLFTKKVMWRHFQTCKFKPQNKLSKPGKSRVQALCAFAEPVPSGFSDAYWRFLSCMNQDKIAVAIKEDPCILEYGYRLFSKNERVISQHQYIRQKLRELGRLLLEAKKVAPVKSVKNLIKPENYSHVVTTVKRLTGFNHETGRYQCPSLARKVGHSLHSLAMFVKSEGLKIKDKQTVQNADEFAQLYQESWKFDIASQALTQLDQTKWNCPQVLPFTQDVQILHCYLSEKQQHHINMLKEEPSPSNWKDLAKVTLAQVILFNRRRAGEVSKMPLTFYLSKDTSETHEDVNLALTALEQKLCQHFVRMTIVGKRGRKVPVLITPLMKQSLDALTEKREECGVLKDNGYLFALPHSAYYLRGSDCLRQFVKECNGIKNPQALTSTKLRKHIATLSTVLNLKNTELDQLADFLGHNIEVHRKHYRLPEGTLQLAKISKVLLAMEQGRLGEYKETVGTDGCSQEDMEDIESDGADGCSQEDMKGDCVPGAKGTAEGHVRSQQEDTDIPEAAMSEGEVSSTSQLACTPRESNLNQKRATQQRGKQTTVKRSWTSEECGAVQKHLRNFIIMNQVPGKKDCEQCISAEPEALKNRDWRAVKFFIKNRITAMKRKML